MDLKLENKRALVCAASKGIGKAIAASLAQEGAQVFICARDKDSLSSAAKDLEKISGKQVYYQSCDLTDEQSANSLIASVESVFAGLDILVHNVGGPAPTQALDTSINAWQSGFDRLFKSVALLNQAFIPKMKTNKWGRILAVTSLSVFEPIPNLSVSNAMRSAVTAMLKTLADEVAPHNICVNCVAPGIIHTDRTEETIQGRVSKFGGTRDDHFNEYLKSIPAGRLGTPEEFAAVVTFLCSQQASYITGSTICVDGGKRRSTY